MTDSGESWTSSLINEQLRKRFENHNSAKVTNLARQTCIAANMPAKKNITFEGEAGDNFAGLNNGSKIILNGDAGRFIGNGMISGEIILNGSCDEGAGHCLSGGTIVIQGSVDGDAGSSMKGGDLLISGNVRGNLATCMDGGMIVVCGDVMGDIGNMMTKGKILLSGNFDSNENLNVKNITPSDWKKIRNKLKDYGIDPTGLDFKEIQNKNKINKKSKKSKPILSISETIILVPAILSKRPRTPILDELKLSLSIGKNKNEPLNLTIPLLWKGTNAPTYAIWNLNKNSPTNLESANIAIIDLTPTDINRRLDMKRPTDLAFIVELIRQGSSKRIPILVRLNAGDIENDLNIIEKAKADGIIIVSNEIPIEAAVTTIRTYKNDITILAECETLNSEDTIKIISLGASGIFLKKECTSKELNKFGTELAEIMGSVGVGKINELKPDNLRANDQETAAMTGISLAGYNSVLPMWRH